MSKLRGSLSAEVAKNVCWSWLSPLPGSGGLTMSLSGKFVDMAHHFMLLQLNSFQLSLGLILSHGGLSTLWHSCRFACHQRVLKTFACPGYLHSKDGVV